MTAVYDGQYKVGDKLPAIRKLADELSINVNTVAKVYRELEVRAIVQSYPGKGCFILKPETQSLTKKKKHEQIEILYQKLLSEAKGSLISEDEVFKHIMENTNER